MKKAIFLIPYFGRFPGYFPFFLESCKHNPDFTFLFFTDLPVEQVSENVAVHPMSLSDFNSLVSLKLGFEINIKKPYKICDFKPAYGKIFEDFIQEYEFWGSCDIDVILGDLGAFLPNDLLSSADVYSGVKWYLSGSLFLIRNTPAFNSLYAKSEGIKDIFQDQEFLGFDECAMLWHQLGEGKDLLALYPNERSFTHVLLREARDKNISLHFANDILEKVGKEKVFYKNGHVRMNGQEFLILHFIYLKTTYHFIIPKWKKILPDYFIDDWGLHKMSELSAWRYFLFGNGYEILRNKSKNLIKRITKLDFLPSNLK